MTPAPCPARWEFVALKGAPGWVIGSVYLCAGSISNPDPCEVHGCGYPLKPDMTCFTGPCKCPVPENGGGRT